MESAPAPVNGLGPVLAEGEWAGWSAWTGREPFEEFVGPFFARREDDGRMVCGCRAQPKNLNGTGAVHGGALLTFADYALFLIAYDHLRGLDSVTVSLNGDFLSGAPLGSLLVARGDITKAGRSLLFVRGLMYADDEPVLSFSGVLKIQRVRPTP